MSLLSDLRYNLRLLRKSPGFVVICVLVIGLGMGMSITSYSILSSIAAKPLPFPDGDSFVRVRGVDNSNGRTVAMDGYAYQTLQASVQSYKTFGAQRDVLATFSDGGVAEQFRGSTITSNLLQATAVAPLLGRSLLPQDDIPGAEPVVLISYRVWQDYYAGREDIVGVNCRINGNLYTVIGVMPDGFAFPEAEQVWLPLQLSNSLQSGEGPRLGITGVLAEGITKEMATAEVNALLAVLGDEYPDSYANYAATVNPFTNLFGADDPIVRLAVRLLPLLLTLALVLLVCVNVANLILVRTNERIQEFAICSSLGATRWRLVRSILQDSLIICVLGGLLGVILADIGMSVVGSSFLEMTSGNIPFWMTFDWELGVGSTALLAMLLIWLISAGLAFWQVSRLELFSLLASGKTGATGSRNPIGTAVLVNVEMVISSFLLIIGGVVVGVFGDIAKLDYGTATEGYLTGRINLPPARYADNSAQEIYRENLKRELLEQQGIERVSFSTALPSQYGNWADYNLEDRDLFANNRYPQQQLIFVAADYFETMELTLNEGREFDLTDTAESLAVVIVDENFSDQIWPGESALSKRIEIYPDTPDSRMLTVIGVTTHIIQSSAADEGLDRLNLYLPLAQSSGAPFSVVLKTEGDPESFYRILREAAVRVDRDIAITGISPLTGLIEEANALVIFMARLFLVLALITVVLASTGIYALVSRSVHQRSKETGIRRAVGSSDRQVLWVFMSPGFKYLSIGLLIGGGSAALITSFLATRLPEVLFWLPSVFTIVTIGLALLIFFSTYNPARLLVAIEPGDMLRNE